MTKLEKNRQKAQALPQQPGVYIMKNASKEIIYIGKAKKLKNRVSQYFGAGTTHTAKVKKMVENVDDFDYIIVDSEFEALVLECSLIKQHKPKYNILLKDDKGYTYVRVDDKGWKTIESVKKKEDDGARYFGPYTTADYVTSAVREAKDIYMLPHCRKRFPQDINRNSRPCLNYYIKLCSGACCGKVTQEENNAAVEEALRLILGGRNTILTELRQSMYDASENLEFEKAAKYRDKIKAIEKVSQKQHVVSINYKNQDVFGLESISGKSCLNVMKFRDGTLVDTDTYVIDRIEENQEDYTELISNYYSVKKDYPDRICVDFEFPEDCDLSQYMSKISGKKIILYQPKSGDGLALIKMAKKNAAEKLSRVLSYNDKRKAALYELKELLGLKEFPAVIESYDISNTNGSDNVGGMVVFYNGRPQKKNYRRFIIKSFEGQDDFRSLAEVLNRRIGEYYLDPDSGEGFGVKPDLILLDGGEGQVNAVKKILEARNFDVPLFGMVKDGKHRTRAITANGREITINDNRSVFTFVSELQEEVHRYAISFHQQRRRNTTLQSALTEIKGVGEKRAKNLLIRFGTVDKIKNASIEELMAVPSINEAQAVEIYNYYHK